MAEPVEQLHEYAEIRGLVASKDYGKALEVLNTSCLEESTKKQLQLALESKENYVIERIFSEFDARIMQSLCRSCWR